MTIKNDTYKRMSPQLLLLLLLLFITIFLNHHQQQQLLFVESFQITDNQISQKESNIIGVDVSYALMDLTFDKELYLYKAIGACRNSTCPSVPSVDCSCDYASITNCGSTISNNGSMCPPCPTTYIDPSTQTTKSYCNGAPSWTPVSLNTPYQFMLSIASPLYLRLKSDANTMANGTCHGITILTTQIEGLHYIESSTDLMTITQRTFSDDPNGQTQFTICPTDPIGYTRNTYFITIRATTSIANLTFVAYTGDNIPSVTVSPPEPCGVISAPFSCIVDGFGSTLDNPVPTYYIFPVYQLKSYTFSIPLLNDSYTTLYMNDVFRSDLTKNQLIDHAKWIVNNKYMDSITITLGPHNSTTPRLIYIRVVPSSPSSQIIITSSAKKIMQSIGRDYPTLGGSFALFGTSRLFHSLTNTYSNYNSWSDQQQSGYYAVYPRESNNPLWPLPYVFSTESVNDFFQELNYTESNNPPKNNTYQAAFLLAYQGKYQRTFNSWNDLSLSYIEFNNVLVDIDGNPLEGLFGFQIVQPQCDYEKLVDVGNTINIIQSQLYESESFQVVASLQFSIDLLTMTDVWIGCSNEARQLSVIELSNVSRISTECQYEYGSVEWGLDPCCNSTQAFFQCCVPRPIDFMVNAFKDADRSKVAEFCSAPDCTSSVLLDYYAALTDINEGDCTIDNNHLLSFRKNISDALDYCKYVYQEPMCNDNADCTLSGSVCNIFTRKCQTPVSELDRQYVICIVAQLPTMATFYLKNTLELPDDPQSSEFVDMFLSKTSSNDCNYKGLDYRAYYDYENIPEASKVTKCYPQKQCYDALCNPQHDVCLDGYYPDYKFTPHSNTQQQCDQFGFCNWNPLEDCQDATCVQQCTNSSQFCGVCNEQGQCYKISEYTTAAACNGTNVCLLPNGQYILDLTDDQCRQIGQCSESCGYACTGLSTCVVPDKTDAASCASILASWNSQYGFCYFVTSQDLCNAFGHQWVDCPSYSTGFCYSTAGSDPLNNNLCQLAPKPCTTSAQCESVGGSCSDSYYFSRASTGNYNYPDHLSKCVNPTGHILRTDNRNQSQTITPSCNVDTENDSPMGCYLHTPGVFTTGCPPGQVWWHEAHNQVDCLAPKGCRSVQVYDDAIGYRFNQMTEQECTGCQSGTSGNVWTNKFTWTPGHWSGGIPMKLSMQNAAYIKTGNYSKVLDLRTVGTLVYHSYLVRISDLMRSSSLCRMERIEENLKSITCSCAGDGGSECFTTSSVILGETKPCAEEESSFEFSYGNINFDNYSVPFYCASVIISSVTRQIYKSSAVETLSSNFVSYAKPDGYAVRNSNNQVIGIIMSDGVKVIANGVGSYDLCIGGFVKENSEYPVYDFSKVVLNDDNDTVGYLVPMDLQETWIGSDPKTKDPWVCARIVENTTSSTTTTYFAMARQRGWEDAPYSPFNRSTTALIYTLAVIFLLCGLWGMFQLSYVLYNRFFTESHYPFRLVHMLIFTITLFIVIRCVYFFVLPSGKLESSSVSDYILVVLPTFIYFSSFSIITVLWYIVISAKVRHDNIMRRIGTIIAVINIILYLLFVAIVLIFQYSAAELPNNECGGRIVVSLSKTTPQRVVSIVYAVIQAFISLVIGGAFIYLGGNIYLMVKRSTTGASTQHKRIYMVTLCSSVGFVLHCVFFLILVIAEIQNMVFSFIGLIITEIVPALSILYAYNQYPKPKPPTSVVSVDSGGVGSGGGGGKLKKMSSRARLDASTNNLTSSQTISTYSLGQSGTYSLAASHTDMTSSSSPLSTSSPISTTPTS